MATVRNIALAPRKNAMLKFSLMLRYTNTPPSDSRKNIILDRMMIPATPSPLGVSGLGSKMAAGISKIG